MSALDLAAADLLDRAAGRVARGWTQGWFARDAEGQKVPPDYPSAVCWCLVGSMEAERPKSDVLDHCYREAFGLEDPVDWNDDPERTQAEVVEALRTAAARLRGEA